MSRLLLISVLAGLALSPDRSATQLTAPDSASACKALVEKEAFAEALVQCREATRNEPVKAPILEAAARAEFEAGEALKAAELYQTVISSSTWKEDTALARAAALWRGSKVLEAEAEFRACLEKTGSAKASQHLISFLIAFGRYAEVPALAREGSKEDPRLCTLSESWGVSEAAIGNFPEAARLFQRAIEGGCPRFRWTTIGPMSGLFRNPAFKNLLVWEQLLEGVSGMPENEALQRLWLLDYSLDAKAAPGLAGVITATKSNAVRLRAGALLAKLGPEPLDPWKSLLASNNFLARRVALRQILQLNSPAFVPLLSDHLKNEALPGNKAIASLALARLLAEGPRKGEAVELLKGIPDDDDLYPVALEDLATILEKDGHSAQAEEFRKKGKAAADRKRMIPAPDETAPGVPKR